MPRPQHYYGLNHLHYLTASTYRRARIFDSDRFKLKITRTLDELRAELGFRIIGYVLIPQGGIAIFWSGLQSLPTLPRSCRSCESARPISF